MRAPMNAPEVGALLLAILLLSVIRAVDVARHSCLGPLAAASPKASLVLRARLARAEPPP